jgi:hypothetical protein
MPPTSTTKEMEKERKRKGKEGVCPATHAHPVIFPVM